MKKIFFLFAVLTLFLSGCREETDLYFYTDQKWKVEAAITVDQAMMDLALGAGGMAVGSELGVSVPGSLLQSDNWIGLSLDWMVAQYRSLGLDARWTQSTNTYTLTVKGNQFTELPGVSDGLITLEPVVGATDQYHLQMQAIDMGEIDPELAAMGLGYDRVITLHAGKIIQSNATEVRGGRAIWRNPGLVDVVFEPASPFPTPIVFTFLCLGSIAGTITLAVRRFGGRPCPSCGKRTRKGQEICPNCGGYISYLITDI